MLNTPEISIILPSYNAQSSLPKALNALQLQTFTDFEVIMVDDGSTDSTYGIMKEFLQKDSRFKAFSKRNEGVAMAREFGVKHAKGEYIIHHDADDFMPPDALSLLYNTIREEGTDLAIGNFTQVRTDTGDSVLYTQGPIRDWKEFVQKILDGGLHGSLCNKMLRQELYEGIRFEPGINFREDLLLLARICFLHKPSISFCDANIYNYLVHSDSLTLTTAKSDQDTYKKVILLLEDLVKDSEINLNDMKMRYKAAALLYNYPPGFMQDFKETDAYVLQSKKFSRQFKLLYRLKLKGWEFLYKCLLYLNRFRKINLK